MKALNSLSSRVPSKVEAGSDQNRPDRITCMQLNLSNTKLPLTRLLVIAPFFLWGTAMVAMKGVIPQTTPLFVAGVRSVPAGALVVGVAMWLGRPQPQGWAAWLWIAGFALVDGSLFQGFLAEGLARTGAGLGSVMIDSQPLVVALLALWLFGERIGFWGWLGLTLGVLGISLIGLPDQWILELLKLNWLKSGSTTLKLNLDAQQLFANGEDLMLVSAFCMAIGTVMIRVICRHADPIAATGWHMILGGLPLFAGSQLWESEQWIHLSLFDWLSLGYATVCGSAIAYGLFFYFAASGSLTSISSLTFLTPVFALLFGYLFLAEVLSPIQWMGVCLTLASIYLINQRDNLANGSHSLNNVKPPTPSSTPQPHLKIEVSAEPLETNFESIQ